MKAYYDLHIHSALSPCAEAEMTPNNIVNMAVLKGLDIIAVTDHNSAENLKAIMTVAENCSLVVVPGMEVETREEVHMVCLFNTLDDALKMQEIIYKALPPLENREDIFGQQAIMDENDGIIGNLGRMLITAADISVDEIFKIVGEMNGIVIPAHVDRDSYSIISNLGIIPEYLGINSLEVSKDCNIEEFCIRNPEIRKYRFLQSSDAHSLGAIMEQENYIELEEVSARCLLDTLRANKQY